MEQEFDWQALDFMLSEEETKIRGK